MKILIICKGSSEIGLGHLIRAHSFALMASKKHKVRIIAVIEPHLDKIFNGLQNFTTFVRNELDAIKYILKFDSEIILFDFISADDRILKAAKKKACITASLSPVFDKHIYLDALFTRNPDQENMPGVKIFKGYDYAVFKENCFKITEEKYIDNATEKILPVAICMGGGDAANKTLMVLESLIQVKYDCIFWVLLGEGYQHSYQDLVNITRTFSNHEVILAKTNRSMWRVMGNCALAILAGGLTTAEAVYAGLPTINIFEKKEHKNVMRDLLDKSICLDGGEFSISSLNNCIKIVEHLHINRSVLIEIRKLSSGIYDNQGGHRISNELGKMLKKKQV